MRTSPLILTLLASAAAADASLPPSPPPTPPSHASPPPGRGLTATEIVGTLEAVRPDVARCWAAFGRADLAVVQLTIEPDGRVTWAHVSGAFDATPTGACIERAVRAARFPAFAGGPRVLQYPYRPR